VLLILVVPHSSILRCYWILLILRWSLSSIVMCYWFLCDLIPACFCFIDSRVTSLQHTEELLIRMVPHSSILMCYWFSYMVSHFSILMCYWFSYDLSPAYWCLYRFSCDLIPAYWCIFDSHVTSFQHIDYDVTLFQHNNLLMIIMRPHTRILKYYWLSGDLILAY
jgi:hypothetical protein